MTPLPFPEGRGPVATPAPKALLVSAARSGSGKTVVAIGLQRAFARQGLRIAAAKAGPDYIDPAFHHAATGRPSINLDGFAMSPAHLLGFAANAAEGTDLLIAEGVMGLFDGTAAGSSAALATTLGWPVLLVLDASASAQTVAAVAHGLATFPGGPPAIGALVNRVASPRHGRMIAGGFRHIGLPLFGLIPTDDRLALPSRHLGLVQAEETAALAARIDGIADVIAEHVDLAAIHGAARPVTPAPLATPTLRPPGQRIAIARDAAFGFLYPHLLDGWRRAGAEIAFFSPLADEGPPETCDVCWLPGGYPELHAGRIAGNARFLDGLRSFAKTRPVHGECGGYMVLGRMLEDADGTRHAMAGLLPIETSFSRRRLHLGYRRATWRTAMPFAAAGATSTGHEFHYATLTTNEGEPLADMVDGEGTALPPAGTRVGRVTGSFFHLIT
jgi:cobyrinic acid a,c-diamide synthase